VARVATYDRIRDLPLVIDSYSLEPLEAQVSSEFTRLSTVIRLSGDGQEGVGEDVTYDALDHIALQDAGAVQPLAGEWTIESFSQELDLLDLFPAPPVREPSINYRRWAFESAALDLALRQAGESLAEVLGREPRPVTFVMSLRLGEPASIEPVERRLESYPTLRFKLDATMSWTAELVEELVETGAVDSVDLKGMYHGTAVDVEATPELYAMVARAFPHAWLEDPDMTRPDLMAALDGARDRITWDAPIHSIRDIDALPFPPKMVNIKPSRFGPLHELFAAYDYCAERGIGAYGGGQFELGPGRGHIQYLASLFHPDTPNDVAPSPYNLAEPPPGLPVSPLEPMIEPIGFRWTGSTTLA
jgi:L-alanine-DL-glutamate epimerase-like enolase superfamily enzyme